MTNNQLFAGMSLEAPERNEVSGAETRKITFRGSRLVLKTPLFYRKTGLKFVIYPNNISVLVPLDENTKKSLQTVEAFVNAHVVTERYKPLFLGNAFYANVSKFCVYEQVMPDGSIQKLDENTFLGSGDYIISIHVRHCYIGPHRNGETASISLQVSRILYRPRDEERDLTDLLDILTQDMITQPSDVAAPTTQQSPSSLFTSNRPTPYQRNTAAMQPIVAKPQKKKKTGGRRRGTDEIDGPKNVSAFLANQVVN